MASWELFDCLFVLMTFSNRFWPTRYDQQQIADENVDYSTFSAKSKDKIYKFKAAGFSVNIRKKIVL